MLLATRTSDDLSFSNDPAFMVIVLVAAEIFVLIGLCAAATKPQKCDVCGAQLPMIKYLSP